MTDEDFERRSAHARGLVAAELRRLFTELRPEAELRIVDPISPLALFAAVQSADGRRVAQVSAHATGASVLLGADGVPCPFDGGTPAERALRVGGAVASALALHRVALHVAAFQDRPAPEAVRLDVRPGDLFAVPEPDDNTFRVAEVAHVDDEGLRIWGYVNAFDALPEAVDPTGLRRLRLHETTGEPAAVPWAEFETWRAVPVRRR